MTRHSADSLLLAALAEGRDVTAAAKSAGVSLSTARRRLNDSEFKGELNRLQAEMVASAVATLTSTSEAAALTLRALLGPSQPPSVRLAAAVRVLELGADLRRSTDVEQRLAAVEQELALAEATTPSLSTIPRKSR